MVMLHRTMCTLGVPPQHGEVGCLESSVHEAQADTLVGSDVLEPSPAQPSMQTQTDSSPSCR